MWQSEIQTKTIYNSETGAPINDVSHFVYDENRNLVGCLSRHNKDVLKNLNLIVAAPEMLEILENVLLWMGTDEEYRDKINSVIKKAKGE